MGGVLWLNYQPLGVDPLPSEHRFTHNTLPTITFWLWVFILFFLDRVKNKLIENYDTNVEWFCPFHKELFLLDNFLALIQNYFTLNQYSHL